MKQWNIKTPLVFRLGVVMLCMLIISLNMIGNLYARYTTSVTGSASAQVARISYYIDEKASTHTFANATLHTGAIFAVEETFTIENDGDVSYEYSLDLSLTDAEGNGISGYTLLVPGVGSTIEIHTLKAGGSIVEEDAPVGQFYCQRLAAGEWEDVSSNTPHISASLAIGEVHTYQIRYYVDMRQNDGGDSDVNFGIPAHLNYNITCTQID